MDKVSVDDGATAITLDYCPRCGGLWFNRGEVGQLARRQPAAFHAHVPVRAEPIRPPCPGCLTPLDRDAERCPACGRPNVLDCPVCDMTMERRAHAGLVLDLCPRCHGVWFDNAELSAIWRLNLAAATESAKSRRTGRGAEALAVGGDVLVNAMFWTPDLVVYGGMAAGHAAGAAAEVVGVRATFVAAGTLACVLLVAGIVAITPALRAAERRRG